MRNIVELLSRYQPKRDCREVPNEAQRRCRRNWVGREKEGGGRDRGRPYIPSHRLLATSFFSLYLEAKQTWPGKRFRWRSVAKARRPSPRSPCLFASRQRHLAVRGNFSPEPPRCPNAPVRPVRAKRLLQLSKLGKVMWVVVIHSIRRSPCPATSSAIVKAICVTFLQPSR